MVANAPGANAVTVAEYALSQMLQLSRRLSRIDRTLREQDWATRRMVARKMDKARRSIQKQLAEWGAPTIEVADLDPTNAESVSRFSRLGMISGPPGA